MSTKPLKANAFEEVRDLLFEASRAGRYTLEDDRQEAIDNAKFVQRLNMIWEKYFG